MLCYTHTAYLVILAFTRMIRVYVYMLQLTFWPLAVSLRTTRFNIQKFYMALALR